MEFVDELVGDPELMGDSFFHPVKKFLVEDGVKTRMIDEPWTANALWNIAVRSKL
jgi:hypothetical protein